MSNGRWRPNPARTLPWLDRLQTRLTNIAVPTFPSPDMYILSDYGGIHKRFGFHTYTYLCLDLYQSVAWEIQRRAVRRHYLADGRSMSYKKLGDPLRRHALVPFLEAANSICGCLFTFAIDKDIHEFMKGPDLHRILTSLFDDFRDWRIQEVEGRLRVAMLALMLTGGLASAGQNVYWISDQDPVFANEADAAAMSRLLSRLGALFLPADLGALHVGTTAIDEEDRGLEDLAAIPDMASGAIAALCTSMTTRLRQQEPVEFCVPEDLPQKAQVLCDWFADDSYVLRRGLFVVSRVHNGSICVRTFTSREVDSPDTTLL